ncbi:MAG: HAD family hydrolase [Candidatus Binatia bacterium]
MITSIIFDLDGLLADTERLHCLAYQTAMKEHGFVLSELDYAEHWVRRGDGISEWLTAHSLAIDAAAVRARKSAHYLELLATSLRPMDGALELLTNLRGTVRIALASSSYRDAVDGVLAGLNIANFFEVIVSGLDVAQVKPAPEIFLKAADLLGVAPAHCLVLEDAEKGIIAAHRAGMRSVAIPNEYTRHHDFSKATRICGSLAEITPAFLQSLDSDII